jgi:hypothetical protein
MTPPRPPDPRPTPIRRGSRSVRAGSGHHRPPLTGRLVENTRRARSAHGRAEPTERKRLRNCGGRRCGPVISGSLRIVRQGEPRSVRGALSSTLHAGGPSATRSSWARSPPPAPPLPSSSAWTSDRGASTPPRSSCSRWRSPPLSRSSCAAADGRPSPPRRHPKRSSPSVRGPAGSYRRQPPAAYPDPADGAVRGFAKRGVGVLERRARISRFGRARLRRRRSRLGCGRGRRAWPGSG